MLNVNLNMLEESLAETQKVLRDGLLSADIFDRQTGLSLAGHNSNPTAAAVVTQLRGEIDHAMSTAGFPGIGSFFYIALAQNKAVAVLMHGDDIMEGWLLDASRANLGVLFSLAIPRALTAVQSAR